MPVQTRAGSQPLAPKTYRPALAAPKQQQFPHRRRQIKTYGRPTTSRPKRQETLTQMDFVSSIAQETVHLSSEDDDEEESRNKKRRKTMGDTPSIPSSFHTQTLTQLLSNQAQDEGKWQINDSDEEEEHLGFIKETPKKATLLRIRSTNPDDMVPHETMTPLNRRATTEIPSSQSPATPLLMRYSPAKQISPLHAKSRNVSASLPTMKSIQETPRTLVIQDSYSTLHSSPTTSAPKAKAQMTPTKRTRFELPEDKENITPGRTKPKSPKAIFRKTLDRKPLREVPDSDDDFEESAGEDNGGCEPDNPVPEQSKEAGGDEGGPADGHEVDAHYTISDETQVLLVSSRDLSSHDLGALDLPHVLPDVDASLQDEGTEGPTPNNVTSVDGPVTLEFIGQAPSSTPHQRHSGTEMAATQADGYTQGFESQRVSLETIRATGPVSDRSDIIISIYGAHVEKMVQRLKTYEFRAWEIPESVCRVWIYITKPTSELRYMCIFGSPKRPGEIDRNGIGNVDFNAGKKTSAKYAYEVQHMYELNDPVSLELMRQNGWPTAPQKYAYVPPAIVGQLTSNLRCALWGEETEEQSIIPSSPVVTESQELADQIRSDIDHATQLGSSEHADIIPSSPSPRTTVTKRGTPRDGNVFARPSFPQAHPASSGHTLPGSRSHRKRGPIRPSQATTASQVSSSSPIMSPERSAHLPPLRQNQAVSARLSDNSSPGAHRHKQQHSLRSSQFPTRSQMLPDSLLNDDVQQPPSIIWDSADEDSE
ncbi:hypothetical protein BJ170DRAFT_578910 [Xylariales sp. AK1849]|nr:hypothetical protein BJ170DRAFT_578910 [Xylariales sp. AK1849]